MNLRLKHDFGILILRLRNHVVPLLLRWHMWRLALHVGCARHRWERFQSIPVRILNVRSRSSVLILQHLIRSKHSGHADHCLIIVLEIQSAQVVERLPRITTFHHHFGFSRLSVGYIELNRVPSSLKMHFWWSKQRRRLIIRIDEFAWLVMMVDVSVVLHLRWKMFLSAYKVKNGRTRQTKMILMRCILKTRLCNLATDIRN